MPNTSFVKSTVVGEFIPGPLNLVGVVWTGATSAGNLCTIKEIGGDEVWEGRADGSHTYVGIRFPDDGIYIPAGVEIQTLDAGKVFLYFGIL